MKQIMWSSLDYAEFAQLRKRSAIMRKIMCMHNRTIPRSLRASPLVYTNTGVTRGWLQQRAGLPSLNGGGAAAAVPPAIAKLVWWWSGIVVTRWSRSTQLLYIGPS